MTKERKMELFDNAITWVWEHTQEHGKEAYINALKQIGYSEQEIYDEVNNNCAW
jgi:Holliday junction resolvasome RuvABC DNA-binding subunit